MSDGGSSRFSATDFLSAGLYDPEAADATERLELLEYLSELGASVEEMHRADAEGRLFGLSGDRIIRPGRDSYTWTEVSEKVGLELDAIKRALRAYGIPYVGPDTLYASDEDIALLTGFAFFSFATGEETALRLARVIGSTMAKLAEAASQTVRGTTPHMQLENAPSPVTVARTFEAVAQQVPLLVGQLGPLFRHHLVVARRHFELSDSADIAGSNQMRLATGFADLSGFTAYAERLSSQQLAHLLSEFETQVTDVVDALGGRVVKFIGDEVMFVAPLAEQAAQIALHIARGAPPELPARVGLAYGVVLATDGDYFGPPVNLASRLVDEAEPGEVLVDDELYLRLDASVGWRENERRTLRIRGIAEPVEASVIDHVPVSVETPLN